MNQQSLMHLIQMFPTTKVDDSLDRLAKQIEKEIAKLDSLVERIFADQRPMDFQKDAIEFEIRSGRHMLALSPGLGKSMCSILTSIQIEGITLIVAPLTLLYVWKAEIQKWAGKDTNIAVWHGSPSNWEKLRSVRTPKFIITNYDTLSRHMVKYDVNDRGERVNWRCVFDMSIFKTVIFDESVLLKNRKAIRSKAALTVARDIERVYMLTGAPTTKFYDDLWMQFHILDPKRFSSYWRFAHRYTFVEQNQWGSRIVANKPNAHEEIQRANSDIYFCRTQEQVLDLPEWIIEDVPIRMGDKQSKAYLEMEDDFVTQLPDSDEIITAFGLLAQMTRLIQIASNPSLIGSTIALKNAAKWKAVLEMLEFVEFPIIIWTNFIDTAKQMRELLPKDLAVSLLVGSTSSEARNGIQQSFQDGATDVLIAHPAVGKFGLTLTRARTAIYMERSFNGDDYFQSLHRIRRIGTEHSPYVVHLLSETSNGAPTIDKLVADSLDAKTKSSFRLTTSTILEVLDRGRT